MIFLGGRAARLFFFGDRGEFRGEFKRVLEDVGDRLREALRRRRNSCPRELSNAVRWALSVSKSQLDFRTIKTLPSLFLFSSNPRLCITARAPLGSTTERRNREFVFLILWNLLSSGRFKILSTTLNMKYVEARKTCSPLAPRKAASARSTAATPGSLAALFAPSALFVPSARSCAASLRARPSLFFSALFSAPATPLRSASSPASFRLSAPNPPSPSPLPPPPPASSALLAWLISVSILESCIARSSSSSLLFMCRSDLGVEMTMRGISLWLNRLTVWTLRTASLLWMSTSEALGGYGNRMAPSLYRIVAWTPFQSMTRPSRQYHPPSVVGLLAGLITVASTPISRFRSGVMII
mmetsp:Transcript_10701/g.26201  ORF Transcript_10701/g.26201 Transcript_10701/m.26201 type:complete len:355 (-) Transcript_10701:1068-2132(-)